MEDREFKIYREDGSLVLEYHCFVGWGEEILRRLIAEGLSPASNQYGSNPHGWSSFKLLYDTTEGEEDALREQLEGVLVRADLKQESAGQ